MMCEAKHISHTNLPFWQFLMSFNEINISSKGSHNQTRISINFQVILTKFSQKWIHFSPKSIVECILVTAIFTR